MENQKLISLTHQINIKYYKKTSVIVFRLKQYKTSGRNSVRKKKKNK